MTPQRFIEKWEASELKERSAAHEHFLDLCELLDEPKPAEADPKGEFYTFEKGVTKTGGGDGWADIWKRGCFGWEYKGKKKNLDEAYAQLLRYSVSLENPPLLITCDTERFVVRTNWTNTVQEVHEIGLHDLLDAGKRQILKRAFSDPESLKPKKTRQTLTEEAAATFAELAKRLREREHEPHRVAHFVNRLVFCMFAEDIDLLPGKLFEKAVRVSQREPEKLTGHLSRLFAAMKSGGEFGLEEIPWFNGGLFDNDDAIELDRKDVKLVLEAASLHWADIDPSVLGTLFERGLDPDKRSQLGAHYTDRDKIMLILNPVLIEPLTREWEDARTKIEKAMAQAHDADARIAAIRAEAAKSLKQEGAASAGAEKARQKEITRQRTRRTNAQKQAADAHRAFIDRLVNFRVLDPACGSGNFLSLALQALKDLEHRANLDAEALGFPRQTVRTGPENVLGIEINPYAAELARVSIWIGDIQWRRRNGIMSFGAPILRPLDNIKCRDALIEQDAETEKWREAEWPVADVIVGNPPFLGAKLMKRRLGVDETECVRRQFEGRLPGFTDYVCYWFEKARAAIMAGRAARAGLVATNSIRKNTNLPVMHRIVEEMPIFYARSEEKWTVEGAAVDVSLIGFGRGVEGARLDGRAVEHINANLTSGLDLTGAATLAENSGTAYLGIQKSGPFDVPGSTARTWLQLPVNPNGEPNSTILKPYWNGDDLTGRPRDYWLIDLPLGLDESTASLFEAPFHHIASTPDDDGNTIEELRQALGDRAGPRWWEPHWPRPEMRSRIKQIARYLVTPETAQHRLFCWLKLPILPDKNLIVIARDDDTTFGILQSRIHGVWAQRKGSDLQDRPRYTHTSTFGTFPFPEGLTPDIPAEDYADAPRAIAIAEAAKRLNELREAWLNPPDLVRREPEVVPGYPDRILPKDEAAAKELKKRTLTNLYNARPAWLDHAHKTLDEAVADAYGWPADLSDDEILARLFALNQERAAAEAANSRALL